MMKMAGFLQQLSHVRLDRFIPIIALLHGLVVVFFVCHLNTKLERFTSGSKPHPTLPTGTKLAFNNSNLPELRPIFRWLSAPSLPRAINLRQEQEYYELLSVLTGLMAGAGVEFILGDGTLLGSYMVHGILPWDDDMDIMVNVKHVRKVMQIFSDPSLREAYGVTSYHDNQDHYTLQNLAKALYLLHQHENGRREPPNDISVFAQDTDAQRRIHSPRVKNKDKPLMQIDSTVQEFTGLDNVDEMEVHYPFALGNQYKRNLSSDRIHRRNSRQVVDKLGHAKVVPVQTPAKNLNGFISEMDHKLVAMAPHTISQQGKDSPADGASVDPEGSVFAQSYFKVKFYKKSSVSAGNSSWCWPYIDIKYYKDNGSHITNIDKSDEVFHVASEHFHPLHMRPFGNLWLPAPRDTRAYLQAKYTRFSCMSGGWNHRKERERLVKRVHCKKLSPPYPFVWRQKIDEHNTLETLKIGHRVVQRIALPEISRVKYSDASIL